MEKEEFKRYNRQIILSEIGLEGQEKLKAARVLVIGAGGLGCPALQYLVAAGVGSIGIADGDVVDETNLQRQILYSVQDIGRPKATTAAEKLKALNPLIDIRAYPVNIDSANAGSILGEYDLVVDGSDNFSTRYLVNDTCVNQGMPFVFGSIFGFEGQIAVFNYLGGPTYRCVFPDAGSAPNCAENGVLGILPGITGTYMANEALKLILGIGEPLSGKLLVFNVLENSFNIFKVKRVLADTPVPAGIISSETPVDEELNEMSVEEMEAIVNAGMEDHYLIDVREPLEFEAADVGGINIPLSEIPDSVPFLPADKTLIFYCNSGRRSRTAASILKQAGFRGSMYWVKEA